MSFYQMFCVPCVFFCSASQQFASPPHGQVRFLSGVKQVSFQSFLSPRQVVQPRLKDPVCSRIVPIAGRTIIVFIPFSRVLVLWERQSVSSRI